MHPPRNRTRGGFTLVELLVTMVVIGLLASLVVPGFRRLVDGIRVRSALQQLTGDLYHVRLLAVREGRPMQLVMLRDSAGCVRAYRIEASSPPANPTVRQLPALPELCLRHSGDTVVVFNARGMLRPPARSFSVTYHGAADSVLVSIAGRIRRAYRRKRPRGRNLCLLRQKIPPSDGMKMRQTLANQQHPAPVRLFH
jgi:prepilin-type N-terminal cleavage/methylation domain-containing protein